MDGYDLPACNFFGITYPFEAHLNGLGNNALADIIIRLVGKPEFSFA